MNPTTLVTFLYWAALTYYWLDANWRFATAIHQAIRDHNDAYDADDEEENDE